MSCTPSRLHGRQLSNKHEDNEPFFPPPPSISPQTHHQQQPQQQHQQQQPKHGRPEHKMRMKVVLLAAIAAAVMGAFTVASSGLYKKSSAGIRAASPAADDRDNRDLQQPVAGPSTATPAHGRPFSETAHVPVVASPNLEHAAEQDMQGKVVQILTTKRTGPLPLTDFPSVEESTVMFLHVFKCAGSTLRRMIVQWAAEEGKSGAIVVDCDDLKQDGTICLKDHRLINVAIQEKYVAKQKVLAGHFFWGFQFHVRTPYLMTTALRNPLEVFVSGQQFMHRKQTKTLKKANDFVSWSMAKKLGYDVGKTPTTVDITYRTMENAKRATGAAKHKPRGQQTGFIRRFTGENKRNIPGKELAVSTQTAITNLDTFWVVGVVEQYPGFEAVLKLLLDQEGKHGKLWENYAVQKYNTSPVTTPDILSVMDPDMVREFNASLALQWKLYDRAVELWDVRCREVLPREVHEEMCTVPAAPQDYTHIVPHEM